MTGEPAGRMSRSQARLWDLVLRARRVPHRVRETSAGFTVQVPARFVRRAVEEILLYQQENVSPDPAIPLPEPAERSRATLAAMLALCAFFALTQRPWPLFDSYPQYWLRVGVGDAAAVLQGQLWRCVTALSLHADPAHVAGNAVIGGVFLILLARRIGSGTAWLLAVLAGALGNLVNFLVEGPGHASLGFSTAVFGAAGALAGLKIATGEGGFGRAQRRRAQAMGPVAPLNAPASSGVTAKVVLAKAVAAKKFATNAGRGWLVPTAAALALLAALGTAGDNVDIGAHFFGLVVGGGLGAGLGAVALRRGRPDEWLDGRANVLCGALAGALFAACWFWGWRVAG